MIESISFMVALASARDVKPSCVCTTCPADLNTIVNIVFSFGLFVFLVVRLEYCEFAAIESFLFGIGATYELCFLSKESNDCYSLMPRYNQRWKR